MMKNGLVVVGAILVAAITRLSVPNSESELLRFRFEGDTEGWKAIPRPAASAKLGFTEESSGAGGSRSALEVRYVVEKNRVAGILRSVKRLDGAGLRVHLRTDAPTVVVVGVVEQDGSSYHHVVQTSAGDWQLVEASFSSFTLADDSEDENGELDVDQVRTLIVADAAGFMTDGGKERRLWIDEYEVLDRMEPTANPSGRSSSASSASVARFPFEEGTEGWIAIPPPGGVQAKVSVSREREGAPSVGSGALEIRYQVEKKKVAGVLRPMKGVEGAGVKVALRSDAPTVLVLGVVEKDGSSYQFPVKTTARDWQVVEARFADFVLADDSRDENGRLDLDQVQALLIADAAGFLSDAGGERTLRVGSYEILSTVADRDSTSYEPLLATGVPTESGARATAGVTYRKGKFQRGFLTDAPGELVTVRARGLRRDEGTIEMWVSPQFDMADVRDFSGLITMQTEPFVSSFKKSLLLFYSKDRKIVFLVNGDAARRLETSRLDWRAGEWHHLAVSWGPRGRRLYVDGRIAAQNREAAGPAEIAADVVLGNHAWMLNSHRFANTVIDELRLSSGQRSDDEIVLTAKGDGPAKSDAKTAVIERFDGQPAPPLTLAAEAEPFHARTVGRAARIEVVAPEEFSAGSRLSYDVLTPSGASAARGNAEARQGTNRATVDLPSIEWPGFYRIEFRLERGGELLNVGEDWFRLSRPAADSAQGGGPLLFGASGSFVDSHDREEFFRAAAAAGVSTVRLPFEWAEIEPRDGEFVWDKYDRIVAWAERYGVELVPSLFWENPQPAWAGKGQAESGGLSPDIYPPQDLRRWSDFVFRVVDRYKGRIEWWIPANEPNLSRYWYPKSDPEDYVALLKATREASRRADPNAKILGLSVAGVDLRFLEAAFEEGALDYCDAVGLHPYRPPHSPDERVPVSLLDPSSKPVTFLEGLLEAAKLIEKFGGRHKLWLDEAGQPYRNDFIDPTWGAPEETAASHLAKIYAEAKASGVVERVLWFSFWGGDYGSLALLKPDGSPTLPFVAYQAAMERWGAAEYVGEGDRGEGVRSLKLASSRESTEVLWSPHGRKEIPLERGERALDMYGFPLEEATRTGRLTVTSSPCFIVRLKS